MLSAPPVLGIQLFCVVSNLLDALTSVDMVWYLEVGLVVYHG